MRQRQTLKHNKSHKTNKMRIKTYTAFVPKTIKASKSAMNSFKKSLTRIFNNTTRRIKKTAKLVNYGTAKTIKTISRKS